MIYSDSTLTINLAAIAYNYKLIKKRAKGAEVAAVVKADAYGLGVNEVAPVLQAAGAGKFFVANLDEALHLREILPDADIFVFHGMQKGQEKIFAEKKLVPVVNSLEQLEYVKNTPCVIHFDTGMNRLGIGEEVKKSCISGVNTQFLMSHLACADEKNNPKNQEQFNKVEGLKAAFEGYKFSLANSYGVFAGKEYHFDIVRPGIALYGGNPTPHTKNPMHLVVGLTSKILQIREIDSKTTVGYGSSCELPAGSRIATVPVGYADGYFRSLGNTGFCAIKGKKVAVVGRVSMDLITLDISRFAKGELQVGDEVELIGENISPDDVASFAGTICYEVLTNLGKRYKRNYIK